MRDFNELVTRFRGNEYNNLGVNELAELYQQTNDELYLGSLIYNLAGLIYKMAKRYPTLDGSDVTSTVHECILRSVQRWVPGKGQFTTFFGTNFSGDLVCMLEAQMRKKNVFNREAYSLEKMEEDVNFLPSYHQDVFSVAMFSEQCNLDEIEKAIVKLIDEGYKPKEMVEKLHRSEKEIKELISCIRIKIRENYLTEGFTL